MPGANDILNNILGGDENQDVSGQNQSTQESDVTANEDALSVLNNFSGNRNPQLYTNNFAAKNAGQNRRSQGPRNIFGGSAEGTIPAQAFATYFPSELNNIQKGAYTGSMIGSNPIYAPSQLMPYGLIDARQNALAQAADQKAAEDEEWANKMMKAPETKRKAVQQTMQDSFYKGLGELKAKYIKEHPNEAANPWIGMSKDLNTQQWLQTQQSKAQREDEAVESLAKFQTEAEKPGKMLFDQQKQDMADFLNGKIDSMLNDTDPKVRAEGEAAHARIMEMKPMAHPQTLLDAFKQHNDPDDIEAIQGITDKGAYDMITTGSTKGIKNPEAALRIATGLKQLYQQEYAGHERETGFNENDFVSQGLAMYGTKKTVQVQTASNKESGNEQAQKNENIHVEVTPIEGNETDASGEPLKGYQKIEIRDANKNPLTFDKGDGSTISLGYVKYDPTGKEEPKGFGVRTLNKSEVNANKSVEKENAARAKNVQEADKLKGEKDSYDKPKLTQAQYDKIISDNEEKPLPFPDGTIPVTLDKKEIESTVRFNQKKQANGQTKGIDEIFKGNVPAGYTHHVNTGAKTYTIKGKAYSEDAVQKAATASGMTADEYVTEANK